MLDQLWQTAHQQSWMHYNDEGKTTLKSIMTEQRNETNWMQHKLVCVKYSYIHIHRRIFVLGICERGITELVCMISTWVCKGWYGTLPILSSDLAVAFRYTIMEGYKMWRLCIFVPVFLLIEVWFRLGMLWIAIIGLRAGVY